MDSDKILRLAGWAGIGYLVFNLLSNAVYNRLSFGFTKIRLGALHPTGVEVTVTQPITNNNPVSFPIDQMMFDIMYGDNTLARVFRYEPLTIAANDTSELVFSSFLDFSNLSGSVANIIASGQFLQALRVKGIVKSAGLVVPFEHTISIG